MQNFTNITKQNTPVLLLFSSKLSEFFNRETNDAEAALFKAAVWQLFVYSVCVWRVSEENYCRTGRNSSSKFVISFLRKVIRTPGVSGSPTVGVFATVSNVVLKFLSESHFSAAAASPWRYITALTDVHSFRLANRRAQSRCKGKRTKDLYKIPNDRMSIESSCSSERHLGYILSQRTFAITWESLRSFYSIVHKYRYRHYEN